MGGADLNATFYGAVKKVDSAFQNCFSIEIKISIIEDFHNLSVKQQNMFFKPSPCAGGWFRVGYGRCPGDRV